jgi:hypothetical protein
MQFYHKVPHYAISSHGSSLCSFIAKFLTMHFLSQSSSLCSFITQFLIMQFCQKFLIMQFHHTAPHYVVSSRSSSLCNFYHNIPHYAVLSQSSSLCSFTTKFLTTQFHPLSCYFPLLRPYCLPQCLTSTAEQLKSDTRQAMYV